MGKLKRGIDMLARKLGYVPETATETAPGTPEPARRIGDPEAQPPSRGKAVAHHLPYGRHFRILFSGFFLIFAANWFHDFLHDAFVRPEPPGAAILLPSVITSLFVKMADAVGELGIAFVIAFIVSSFVELRAAQRHIQSLEEARDHIETDVHSYFEHGEKRFKAALKELTRQKDDLLKSAIVGAYQMNFDTKYVTKALDTVFGSGVVRDGYDLDFRLSKITEDEANKLGIDPEKFVKLTAEANYRIVNVTQRKLSICSRYGVPIRHDVPEGNQLIDLQVGERRWSRDELVNMHSPDNDGLDRDYKFDLDLPPGEGVKIMTRSVLIKDLSDNEPFGFIHPTSGLTLHVSSEITTLEVGANSRTATKMEPSKTSDLKRYGEWKINGAILPHDSVVVWWRPNLNGKSPAQEPISVSSRSAS